MWGEDRPRGSCGTDHEPAEKMPFVWAQKTSRGHTGLTPFFPPPGQRFLTHSQGERGDGAQPPSRKHPEYRVVAAQIFSNVVKERGRKRNGFFFRLTEHVRGHDTNGFRHRHDGPPGWPPSWLLTLQMRPRGRKNRVSASSALSCYPGLIRVPRKSVSSSHGCVHPVDTAGPWVSCRECVTWLY